MGCAEHRRGPSHGRGVRRPGPGSPARPAALLLWVHRDPEPPPWHRLQAPWWPAPSDRVTGYSGQRQLGRRDLLSGRSGQAPLQLGTEARGRSLGQPDSGTLPGSVTPTGKPTGLRVQDGGGEGLRDAEGPPAQRRTEAASKARSARALKPTRSGSGWLTPGVSGPQLRLHLRQERSAGSPVGSAWTPRGQCRPERVLRCTRKSCFKLDRSDTEGNKNRSMGLVQRWGCCLSSPWLPGKPHRPWRAT